MKKILIASGGFKDVFTPIETCNLIHDLIKQFKPETEVIKMPMVDGGEWSSEVLVEKGFKKIIVPDVIDSMGVKKTTFYVELDEKTAFIAASAIVRLLPEFSQYKNPMNLTSYGFGQLIKHAIDSSYKKIYLGMGGTSTVDGGIGMAQALGLEFSFKDDLKKKYLTGSDLPRIKRITNKKEYDVDVEVLYDSQVSLRQLYIVTKLKISDHFAKERENIVRTLNNGLLQYSKVVSDYIEDNNLKRTIQHKTLDQEPCIGNSGGIQLSILPLFNYSLSKGSEFFYEKFNVPKLIKESNVIITGEGRLDESSLLGKTPTGISQLAKKFNKKVIYIVGDIDERYKHHFLESVTTNLPELFIEKGISIVVSCHPFYDTQKIPNDYQEKIEFYKKNTPEILARELKKVI